MTQEESSKQHLIRTMLQAAVPLWITEFAHKDWEELKAIADEAGEIVAYEGDNILFRSKKPGGSARAFNALAKGTACLAFCPGGVEAFGDHYDAKEILQGFRYDLATLPVFANDKARAGKESAFAAACMSALAQKFQAIYKGET